MVSFGIKTQSSGYATTENIHKKVVQMILIFRVQSNRLFNDHPIHSNKLFNTLSTILQRSKSCLYHITICQSGVY